MTDTSPKTYFIGEFPLILKRHPRARRLKLRFEARSCSALLTLPPEISDKKALQFAAKHQDWIRDQYHKSAAATPLRPGAIIPYAGQDHLIIHDLDRPANIRQDQGSLLVGGPLPGFETRLSNWLRKQARLSLQDAIEEFSPILQLHPHRVTVRDTKSRWGSCSSRKTLSFSWRLIMAPPEILSYVVAHEMAHLKEMNHSDKFWQIVEKLDPNWKKSRRWLKAEGNRLMLIG